jgi:hypothetical protein
MQPSSLDELHPHLGNGPFGVETHLDRVRAVPMARGYHASEGMFFGGFIA